MNVFPRVTIITVSFNSAKSIQDTIESVLTQDYPNIEYIVVDGDSRDGTQAIISRYEGQIAQWISEKDQGMYDAMNKGIAMATGEIIGILNSDDVYMHSAVISEMVQAMQIAKVDTAFADLIYVDAINKSKVLRYYDSGQFTPAKFRWGWMPAHPTFFVKKYIYDLVGPFALDYQIAADFEMLIRILAVQKMSYVYIPKPMVRMTAGGASTANWNRNWILNREIVRACKKHGLDSNLAMLLLKIPQKLWGSLKGRMISLGQ